MKKVEDFEDAFALVPRAAADCCFFSVLTAEDMHADKIDFTQVFVEGSYKHLPEGDSPDVYILPPQGVEEEEGIVCQVLKPLYGIPSSSPTWILGRANAASLEAG